jgi:leucyl/phenylalanyl-tRNA--protein transferase
MIDCQQETNHLRSLGGGPIPRTQFLSLARAAIGRKSIATPWHFDKTALERWL